MIKIALMVSLAIMACSCSSESEDDSQSYIHLGKSLCAYPDVLYIGENNRIAILPEQYTLDDSDYRSYLSRIDYYLDSEKIGSSNKFPFEIWYIPTEARKCKLTITPTFTTELIVWETQIINVSIIEREK